MSQQYYSYIVSTERIVWKHSWKNQSRNTPRAETSTAPYPKGVKQSSGARNSLAHKCHQLILMPYPIWNNTKRYWLFLVPCSTYPENFMKINASDFPLCCWQTNRETYRQTGQTDGRTYIHTYIQTDRRTDGWRADRKKDGQTDGRTYEQTNRQADRRADGLTDKQTDKQLNKVTNQARWNRNCRRLAEVRLLTNVWEPWIGIKI